jgi:LSD1 subclass zinc finger protein
MTALQPLLCQSCRAPVPLGETDEATCPSCNARQPLPDAYRELRAAKKLSAEDAKALDALCAEVGRPDPGWKVAAMFLGFTVGILTLVVLAIGAVVGAVFGFLAAAKVDAGETIGAIIIVVCAAGCGLISVPFVGELVVQGVARSSFDAAYALATAESTQFEIDLKVGAVLYLLSIVPIALALRTKVKLDKAEALRSQLAARPTQSGALGCRSCGAPLEVTPGAIAARCLYCQTDNLVAVSVKAAKEERLKARKRHGGVKELLDAHRENQRSDRVSMWAMLALGPLIAPIICLGGWLLHGLMAP